VFRLPQLPQARDAEIRENVAETCLDFGVKERVGGECHCVLRRLGGIGSIDRVPVAFDAPTHLELAPKALALLRRERASDRQRVHVGKFVLGQSAYLLHEQRSLLVHRLLFDLPFGGRVKMLSALSPAAPRSSRASSSEAKSATVKASTGHWIA
jgi:hypothetical protein